MAADGDTGAPTSAAVPAQQMAQGKIALVDRGGCFFEEKTLEAQAIGASALLVVNTEDSLFTMGSMSETADAKKAAKPKSKATKPKPKGKAKSKTKVRGLGKGSAKEGTAGTTDARDAGMEGREERDRRLSRTPLSRRIAANHTDADTAALDGQMAGRHQARLAERSRRQKAVAASAAAAADGGSPSVPAIPTAMISRSAGEVVRAATASDGVHLRLTVSQVHAAVSSEFFGDRVYPKVYILPNVIFVFSRSQWVALMTSTRGDDWQLYLLGRRDVSAAQIMPIAVDSRGGHRKSVTATGLAEPLTLFRSLTARRCPFIYRRTDAGDLTLR